MNTLRDMIPSQIRSGKDSNVSYYGDRTVVRSEDIHGVLPDVRNYVSQAVVLQEYDDFLKCAFFFQPVDPVNKYPWIPQVYDQTLGSDSVMILYVAKPYLLQKKPWDGKTVFYQNVGANITYSYGGSVGVRTATQSSSVSQQVISPGYFQGDVIQIMNCLTGYQNPDDQGDILQMDLNTGGRAWIDVCS